MDEVFKYIICCAICLFIGRWVIAEVSLFIPEFQDGINYIDELAHEMTHDKWAPVLKEGLKTSDFDTEEAAETANKMLKKVKKSARHTAQDMGIELPKYGDKEVDPRDVPKEEVIDHF